MGSSGDLDAMESVAKLDVSYIYILHQRWDFLPSLDPRLNRYWYQFLHLWLSSCNSWFSFEFSLPCYTYAVNRSFWWLATKI